MTEFEGEKLRLISQQGRLIIVMAFVIGICLVGILSSNGTDADIGDEFTVEDIEYIITSELTKAVTITNYIGFATEFTIPAKVTYGGVEYSVWAIEEYALSGCSSLTSVTIPQSVKYIGTCAFSGCISLTSVTIPEGVESIGPKAFYYCTSLTSVTIPNSVTSVKSYTFHCCTSLTSVTIGSGVTSVSSSAFKECTAFTGFDVNESNPYFKSVEGVLFTKDGEQLVQYPGGRSGPYEIPEGVTTIGNNAFQGCGSLTSLTIGNDVTSIGYDAFHGCASLKTIVICDRASIYSRSSAYTDCHADLEFVTNKTGHSLATYSNSKLTIVLSMETIRTTDCTIYFKTTINQYTITFDTNGGTAIDAITQDYGTAVTAPADPTRTGYVFDGWSPEVPKTMPAEDITIVARWIAIDYVVTFDPNDGTVDSATKTVNYGMAYGELPTPALDDNNFIGWFTAPDDSGVIVENHTVILSAGNHTLYAKWIPIDDDEGDGGMNIGIVIGGVAAVIVLAGAGMLLFMRRRA